MISVTKNVFQTEQSLPGATCYDVNDDVIKLTGCTSVARETEWNGILVVMVVVVVMWNTPKDLL